MKGSTQLHRDVLAELDWDPRVNAAKIGVAAEDGVITLTGTVDSFADKIAAEKAAKRVLGVKAVANDLQVKLVTSSKRSDTELAKAAVHALEWDVHVPPNTVKAMVKDAWVTLEGEVEWNFEREEAGKAIRRMRGVIGVTNLITIKPRVKATDVKLEIENALRRNAELDAGHVMVAVSGGKVSLSGTVRSWAEREDAEHAAWSANGVINVQNNIVVDEGALAAFAV